MLVAIICSYYSSVNCGQCSVENPLEQYPGCFCFWEWNDANHVGNWTYPDYWMQLEDPAIIGFVSISGDNTIHVENDSQINEVYVGPNRWDTTRLVVDPDVTLTICKYFFYSRKKKKEHISYNEK